MDQGMSQFFDTAWQILADSAFWVIASLLIGGLVHEFLPSTRLRERLNGGGPGALGGAVLFGALLPICSCGVIPLAISLYRAGVRLGPVMAFAAATPIINPAAVVLSLALLGPQITAIYVMLGLMLPFALGYITERWGDRQEPGTLFERNSIATIAAASRCGPRAQADPVFGEDRATASSSAPVDISLLHVQQREGRLGTSHNSCCAEPQALPHRIPPADPPSVGKRIVSGLRWGLWDLGPTIAFYMAIGVLLAGLIAAFLPPSWTDTYLRDNSILALAVAGVLGASIYVCAVAHIPLVATLLAAGAAPGVAIVFLVTGTATNLPELIALYKTIGRRTVVIYTASLVLASMAAGAAVNTWLMPGFEPVFNPIRSLDLLDVGERLQLGVSEMFSLSAVFALMVLIGVGLYRRISGRLMAGRRGGNRDCCSG
jgi:uncharacterized membrane protein YraQ (UPF0718 family)